MDEIKTWIRPNHIVIDNHLLPGEEVATNILFNEEKVIMFPDGSYIKKNILVNNSINFISEEFTKDKEDTQFDILDSDGNSTGKTLSYKEFYNILMSLYNHVISIKDERVRCQYELIPIDNPELMTTPVRGDNEISIGVDLKPVKPTKSSKSKK